MDMYTSISTYIYSYIDIYVYIHKYMSTFVCLYTYYICNFYRCVHI